MMNTDIKEADEIQFILDEEDLDENICNANSNDNASEDVSPELEEEIGRFLSIDEKDIDDLFDTLE